MLNWANRFNIFCFLDNLHYNFNEPAFECLLAAGVQHRIEMQAGKAFNGLKDFYSQHKNKWLFGHFGYDLKNETEQLQSNNFDGIGFADIHFFVPEIVLQLNERQLTVFCDGDAAAIFKNISEQTIAEENSQASFEIKNRISKEDYISSIKKIQQHILRGDCYELNFCQEFFAQPVTIDILSTYKKLSAVSPNPFAALYKVNDRYCICASPERYLKKAGNKIFSQPIKGTSSRNENKNIDDANKQHLLNSQKEKSENVMVVDLVRNDLSKICKEATVKVDELFGIYSFPQVHQMISTISGEIKDDIDWVNAVKATFPMGSMTGAPKKRVMQLIEQYEQTKRGLFSGSIGYINPNGDFDFNVVIRSTLYNAEAKYLSFQTGSAITFYSNAEEEYNECLLKAAAIKSVLK
ncbi:anthranilate synthase component I family protein [Ferruginibacter albus]|nr:anthranilate synthase component I family protein [Ferruginibacter albus]